MLLLAAAIVSAATAHGPPPGSPHGPPPSVPHGPPQHAGSASIQARATIRIISGASLRLGKVESCEPFIIRDAIVRSTGVPEPVRLFEFQ